MISYLHGQIQSTSENSITVSNGFVGYEVNLPSSYKLETKTDIELFIYTKVREDDISLFGFLSKAELQFFKQLIAVNGVGPKVALDVLSFATDKVKTAIIQNNVAFLSKIPHIGKKTAERIIMELKSKVMPEQLDSESTFDQEAFEELSLALKTLGYQKYEVNRFLKNIKTPEKLSTEELVTQFLKQN